MSFITDTFQRSNMLMKSIALFLSILLCGGHSSSTSFRSETTSAKDSLTGNLEYLTVNHLVHTGFELSK